MPRKAKTAMKTETNPDKKALADIRKDLTSEEVQAAEKALRELDADKDKKRRVESSMSYYAKATGEAYEGERITGQRRREFMLSFLAMKSRSDKSNTTMSSEHSVTQKATAGTRKRWMGKHAMINQYGEKKAMAWIESNQLKRRADKITGSAEDDMCDFYIESDFEEEAAEDETSAQLQAKSELDNPESFAETSSQLADMASASVPSLGLPASSSGEPRPIKTEPIDTDVDPLSKLKIMQGSLGELRMLRDYEIDVKMMKEEASKMDYAAALAADASAYLPKVAACIRALEKLVLTNNKEILNVQECVKLDAKVRAVCEKYWHMHSWAVRFGFAKPRKKARKAS